MSLITLECTLSGLVVSCSMRDSKSMSVTKRSVCADKLLTALKLSMNATKASFIRSKAYVACAITPNSTSPAKYRGAVSKLGIRMVKKLYAFVQRSNPERQTSRICRERNSSACVPVDCSDPGVDDSIYLVLCG